MDSGEDEGSITVDRTADNGGDITSILTTEEQEARAIELDELEKIDGWTEAKRKWKDKNPDLNIKPFKERYIQGEIERLPWEGYIQNGEQGRESLWNKLRKDDD